MQSQIAKLLHTLKHQAEGGLHFYLNKNSNKRKQKIESCELHMAGCWLHFHQNHVLKYTYTAFSGWTNMRRNPVRCHSYVSADFSFQFLPRKPAGWSCWPEWNHLWHVWWLLSDTLLQLFVIHLKANGLIYLAFPVRLVIYHSRFFPQVLKHLKSGLGFRTTFFPVLDISYIVQWIIAQKSSQDYQKLLSYSPKGSQ